MEVHITGYSVDMVNDVPQPAPDSINPLTGLLNGGNLEVYVHVNRGKSSESIIYILIPSFDISQPSQAGTAVFYFVNPPAATPLPGAITLTAIK